MGSLIQMFGFGHIYIYIYESFVRNREAPFHGSRTRFNDALKVDVGVNMFI